MNLPTIKEKIRTTIDLVKKYKKYWWVVLVGIIVMLLLGLTVGSHTLDMSTGSETETYIKKVWSW